jgi:O-antigen/teichoic acid export membrane protein
MAWTLVVGFQTYVFWYAILAIHRERQVLAIQVAGLAINGVLNVVLIPPYGPKGAAAALLVSDFVIFVSQVPIVHRNAFRLPFRRLLIPPIAGIAGAAAVVVPLAQANAIAAAAAGVAAYGMIVVLPGYITRDEWASIMQPLRNLVTRPARAM